MAKKTKSNAASRSARSPSTEFIDGTISLATAADLKAAASLPPSNRKTAINEVSTTLAGIYATPEVKSSILGIKANLADRAGCDNLDETFEAANESVALAGIFERLRALADRVGQRIIENNKTIKATDTALGRVYKGSANGSAVKKGLTQLTKLRSTKLATTKTVRTKNKNAKKRAAGQSKA